MPRPPPSSTLFPYTTLFRSAHHRPTAHHTHPPLRQTLPHARPHGEAFAGAARSEEHTSELQSPYDLVCRLLLEKKKKKKKHDTATHANAHPRATTCLLSTAA